MKAKWSAAKLVSSMARKRLQTIWRNVKWPNHVSGVWVDSFWRPALCFLFSVCTPGYSSTASPVSVVDSGVPDNMAFGYISYFQNAPQRRGGAHDRMEKVNIDLSDLTNTYTICHRDCHPSTLLIDWIYRANLLSQSFMHCIQSLVSFAIYKF